MEFFGTHNSVTGEKGYGFFRFLKYLTRTQKYTIIEQAKTGVKYFDIKVRKTYRGWICTNGLWETEKTMQEIFKEISKNTIHEEVFVGITYDGTLPKEISQRDFLKFIKKSVKRYPNLIVYSISEMSRKKETEIWCKRGLNLINSYDHRIKENLEEKSRDDKTIVIVDFYDK